MRWRTGRRSGNVVDRRGAGLGGMGVRRAGFGGGIGLVAVIVIALLFGVDPSVLLQGGGTPVETEATYRPGGADPALPGGDEMSAFVSVVLADTEDTWHAVFAEGGGTYQEPLLVLFSGAVQSGCGYASAQVGPFYCPADGRIYLDLEFFDELARRFGAPGDFAQAYVIAHEVGHHVQTLLGVSEEVEKLNSRLSQAEVNALSVMVELQADCFSGLWANHADRSRQVLESGDVEEALGAATAIGDDRLQRQSQGYVTPDSFTHGSSEQRVRWFRTGFDSGRLEDCDTFSAGRL